jgi:hypothetical protein
MEIRWASDGDLGALVAALGQRHVFADCLARQRGGGVLLVACGTVVGTWQERDHDGPPVTVSEILDTLVRRL